MLWVYSANDHFFGPDLAQQLDVAFTSAGGNVDFVGAPAFGSDGHGLFSPAGIPVWPPYVEKFLQQQNLTMRAEPLPLPLPAIAAPRVLGPNGQKAFAAFLIDARPTIVTAESFGGLIGRAPMSSLGQRLGDDEGTERLRQASGTTEGLRQGNGTHAINLESLWSE